MEVSKKRTTIESVLMVFVLISIICAFCFSMKDLIVNFIGAVVFSAIGIVYLKHRGEDDKGKLAASLIPKVNE